MRGGLQAAGSIVLRMVDAVKHSEPNVQHLLGVLGTDEDGNLCLEGTTMFLRVVFDENCVVGAGVYCDGHIVIAAGKLKHNKTFWIEEMVHPPRDFEAEGVAGDCLDLFGGEMSEADVRSIQWQHFARSFHLDLYPRVLYSTATLPRIHPVLQHTSQCFGGSEICC
eukprot:GHVQ01013944.1.p1 GENE.GHVQ01013944.1~~GHVQ01013944.1.p1  ORF type:complete len:166 (+),score=19.93 GHVQ01013944.1:237-734(+)